MIARCALCHHTGLDVESRIVADESPLGYHREPRCVDEYECAVRVIDSFDTMDRVSVAEIEAGSASRGVDG